MNDERGMKDKAFSSSFMVHTSSLFLVAARFELATGRLSIVCSASELRHRKFGCGVWI
jgi:hypothetical protein